MVGRDEDEGAFLRTVTFPEEDRHLFTTAPWRVNSGGFDRPMSFHSSSGGSASRIAMSTQPSARR
jgi:hypothetical protein